MTMFCDEQILTFIIELFMLIILFKIFARLCYVHSTVFASRFNARPDIYDKKFQCVSLRPPADFYSIFFLRIYNSIEEKHPYFAFLVAGICFL